jgi:hypothetical protein
MVLALMLMTSTLSPFLLKKPFWSATQIGVFDGVLPAQAMRIRSWPWLGLESASDSEMSATNSAIVRCMG